MAAVESPTGQAVVGALTRPCAPCRVFFSPARACKKRPAPRYYNCKKPERICDA